MNSLKAKLLESLAVNEGYNAKKAEKDILKLLNGDKKAAEIVLQWYENEGWDWEEDGPTTIDDILDMVDACTNKREARIVGKAASSTDY